MDDMVISFSDIGKAIVVGMVTLVVWIFKKLGTEHIDSVKSLREEIAESRKETIERLDRMTTAMHEISDRVTVVEVKNRLRNGE
jgi:hypothetical protein